ncbi:hypothetical protein PGB90_000134 [Kerria lacca]
MIDRKFERLFEIEKKRLANIKNFSLTTNAWTASHSLASIFGITGHYINNNGVLSSVVLESTEMTERHTAVVISDYTAESIA